MGRNKAPEALATADGRLTVTRFRFAAMLGISPGRVTRLCQAGMPSEFDGRIDPIRAEQWCAEHGLGRRQVRDPHLARVRLEIERERIRRLRLMNGEASGQLIDRAGAMQAVTRYARMLRDAHLTWPARVAPVLAAQFGLDQGAVFRFLDAAMREHLRERAKT